VHKIIQRWPLKVALKSTGIADFLT
jgi:hypothetical protein